MFKVFTNILLTVGAGTRARPKWRLRLQLNTQLRVAPASVKYPNSGWLRLQLNTPIPSGSGSISETLEEGLEL